MPTKKRHPDAVQALIEKIGASFLASRLRHENVSTVSSWKARSSIPLAYWPAIISAALEKGINLDEATLVRIHLARAEGVISDDQAAFHAA